MIAVVLNRIVQDAPADAAGIKFRVSIINKAQNQTKTKAETAFKRGSKDPLVSESIGGTKNGRI